jgi:hypothetical protein
VFVLLPDFVTFFVIGFSLILIIFFIIGVFEGSKLFCRLNEISVAMPFIIVLPVNFLLGYSLLSIAPLAKYLDSMSISAKDWAGVWSEKFGIQQLRLTVDPILYLLSISTQVRLVLLLSYVVVAVFVIAIMEAIKSRVPGESTVIQYWIEKLVLAIDNVKNVVRPIAQTWWAVNRYALSRRILVPIYYLCIFLISGLIVFPLNFGGPIRFMVLIVSLILLGILIPLFVHTASGYKLSLFKQTLDNFTRAHINILLWVVPCVLATNIVVVDIPAHQLSFGLGKVVPLIFIGCALMIYFSRQLLNSRTPRRRI